MAALTTLVALQWIVASVTTRACHPEPQAEDLDSTDSTSTRSLAPLGMTNTTLGTTPRTGSAGPRIVRFPAVYSCIMPKKIHIDEHPTMEELGERYREATDGVERSHYQLLRLLSQGTLTREVAEATGYGAG